MKHLADSLPRRASAIRDPSYGKGAPIVTMLRFSRPLISLEPASQALAGTESLAPLANWDGSA